MKATKITKTKRTSAPTKMVSKSTSGVKSVTKVTKVTPKTATVSSSKTLPTPTVRNDNRHNIGSETKVVKGPYKVTKNYATRAGKKSLKK